MILGLHVHPINLYTAIKITIWSQMETTRLGLNILNILQTEFDSMKLLACCTIFGYILYNKIRK